MKSSIVKTLSLLSVLGMTGMAFATEEKASTTMEKAVAQTASSGKAVAQGAILNMTAQVQAVDLKDRQLTLTNKEGDVFILDVPEEVTRLAEVNVGDLLNIQHRQGLAVAMSEVETGGVNVTRSQVGVARASGSTPAGIISEHVKAIATVAWIDKAAREVTLRGAGQTVNLKISEDINLDNIEVGDQVMATYVQNLAINFTPVSSEEAQAWSKQ